MYIVILKIHVEKNWFTTFLYKAHKDYIDNLRFQISNLT